MKYDVSCLQETYVTNNVVKHWQRNWKGTFLFTPGTNHSKGQIILINKNTKIENIKEIISNERLLGLTFEVEGTSYTILNIYVPAKDSEKTAFFHYLSSVLEDLSDEEKSKLIICGDFNVVLSNGLDIIAGAKHDEKYVNMFNEFVHLYSLNDAWRYCHGEKKDFTWSRSNPFIARRLDYIFVSDDLICHISDICHKVTQATDHKAIMISLKDIEFKRGPGYWKLNTSLLKDEKYISLINNCIDNTLLENNDLDSQTLWEF